MLPAVIDPVAFSIGSLEVHWYGILIGFGAFVGLLMAIREGKRFGIPNDFFLDLLLYGTPSAIIGARVYYVAFKWDYYREHPGEIIQIWHGGLAIYGALIGAVLCGVWYTRRKKVPFWRIADICAPSLIAGQMIGRWGNFVNREAYGGPVPESYLRETLHLPDFIVDQMYINGQYHHPTFLYESVWNLLVLVLLLILRRWKALRAGELFWSYFLLYSFGRFFIEGLRTDSLAFHGPAWLASIIDGLWSPMRLLFGDPGYLDPAYGNIRTSQLLALLLVMAAIVAIAARRASGLASARYGDPVPLPAGFAPGGEAESAREAALKEGAPGKTAAGEAASTPVESGEAAAGERAPGEAKPGEVHPGEATPGGTASGKSASGETASGESASGEEASGKETAG